MVGVPIYLHASRRQPGLAANLHGISARKFFGAAAKNFILLQLLFLALFSYIFGSLYLQGSKIHNMKIVFVDYDQGAIGAAVREAYGGLQSHGFPTLVESTSAMLPTPSDIESAVCRTEYWAALYILPNSSTQLHDALLSSATSSLDRGNIMAYVWNQARYSTVIDQAIASNVLKLSDAARVAYTTSPASNISVPSNVALSPATLSLLAQPWDLLSINIQPTSQGSRAIYNTVAIILIMMQEFFYLGVINSLHHNFKVYTKLRPTRIILIRNISSVAYCFIGSLCISGAIWAFRSGWHVNGNQFVLTWMTFWLFAHINFQVLDVVTVWFPLPYVPMGLAIWLVINVSSVILPFELSAGWYRVGYAIPAHEAYQTLIDIWSRGCNPTLKYALPVMFAWEVVATSLAAMGVYRRSHYAALGEAAAQKQFEERVDVALEFQRKRERELKEQEEREKQQKEDEECEEKQKEAEKKEEDNEGRASGSSSGVDEDVERDGDDSGGRSREDQRLRREVAEAIQREDQHIERERRRESKGCPGYGPTFGLAFGQSGERDDD